MPTYISWIAWPIHQRLKSLSWLGSISLSVSLSSELSVLLKLELEASSLLSHSYWQHVAKLTWGLWISSSFDSTFESKFEASLLSKHCCPWDGGYDWCVFEDWSIIIGALASWLKYQRHCVSLLLLSQAVVLTYHSQCHPNILHPQILYRCSLVDVWHRSL